MKIIKILLVIRDGFFSDILKFVLEAYLNCEVTPIFEDNLAIQKLKEDKSNFDFVIYDYDPFSSFVDDLRKNFTSFAKLQSIILCQPEHAQNISKFETETGYKILKKDDIPLGLIRHICSHIPSPELLNDSNYCRIGIHFLSRFDGIKKNLFIKIGSDKMIQIFKEDDKLVLADIMKYHTRGIEYLYLKRSTAEAIVTQLQRQIKVFLKANNFKFVLRDASDSPESQFEQRIIRINEEVFIDDEFQKIILDSIERMKSKVMKEKRIDLFLSHLMNMPNYFAFFSRKVELTSMFTMLISEKLKLSSKITSDKVMYAAVLCDITLAARPKLLQLRDLEEFKANIEELSEEDRSFFLSHPQECAALANKFFQTSPADTGVLILQHHELPDGSGFPGGLRGDKISQLSAIFIISNDVAHYVLTNEAPSIDEYLQENKSRWDFINFRKPYQALLEIRQEKLKSPVKKTN
ncbi:MAG TPA: HD domain-containing phosphohydrolase [Bacteriovoracaceae bacterium]|nr:HD domain-containing phosphohydrolase [Bacteriovoracaceae bacterium]